MLDDNPEPPTEQREPFQLQERSRIAQEHVHQYAPHKEQAKRKKTPDAFVHSFRFQYAHDAPRALGRHPVIIRLPSPVKLFRHERNE
jgi:hypothetical protein